MSLAWAGSEDAPYAVGANKFSELVTEYTDGEIQVNLFCCFEMGGEQEMFKKLQLGTLDGAIVAQNNVGPFFPLIDLFVLPYIFTSFDHAVEVVDGPIGEEMAAQMLEQTGVHLISFVDISFRNIYNSQRPIESFEDVGGLRYRVPQNVVMIDTYTAFGAEPTPIAWSETFTATQTGVVDGGDTPVFWLKAAGFYEITKHYAITEHFALTSPLLVSDRFMQRLSPEHQEAVRRAGFEAALFERQNTLDSEAAIAEEMQAAGVMFTYPDKAPFIEAAAIVQSEFAESRGEEYLEMLSAIEAAAN
jgi:tripartite ATP-independent transporter DctP family solute receptor